ncbi:DUF2213 domain-containing protein [Novosphingobium sp. MBES04]|uniref:DUF2213 domain-containing protein n=1 Tax=Novosphingobium sp. MBES04 TaxID=1206458 RepID=UPI000694FB13|nr:DUF2213 domain-containing protein [Novosphingobium sp. MBES04]
MQFRDSLTLDAPRRLNDGAMAVRARAARTGVYQYAGSEVDPENKHNLRDTALVNVLRDDGTVFDEKSVRSFIGKPITDDHPAAPVTTSNWRDHARGTIMGAMRDGEYLAFDLLLTDAEAIAKVDGGKRELSNGYSSDLQFGDFTAPDGTKCQARQTSISGNHVALVDRGRAGSECAIKDGFAVCDTLPSNLFDSFTQEKPVKTILIDGLTVDMANTDTAIATVQTLIAARDAATAQVTDLTSQVATLTAESQTKDAKITTLEQQVKDAKPTPAQLREAGKALMVTADKAKSLGVTVSDEMDETAIMTATVTKHMGDAAKDWSADQIAASFAVLTKDAKPEVKPIGAPKPINDSTAAAANARAEWLADKQTAYRGQAA